MSWSSIIVLESMPPHAILRENKTTKMRIAFGTSLLEDNVSSLNDNLSSVANLTPDILTSFYILAK